MRIALVFSLFLNPTMIEQWFLVAGGITIGGIIMAMIRWKRGTL